MFDVGVFPRGMAAGPGHCSRALFVFRRSVDIALGGMYAYTRAGYRCLLERLARASHHSIETES